MFDQHKKILLSNLLQFLSEKQKDLSTDSFGEDTYEKLKKFLENGKMVRGGLVLESYLLFNQEINTDVIQVGSALELLHSALIVHDDIMDEDTLRRGQETIFSQYEAFGKRNHFDKPLHFGEGMGICVGDLGFFLGFELLSKIHKNAQEIMSYASKELQKVALGQMRDVYTGNMAGNVSEKEILALYADKTGRYTFSLPLTLGAILAGHNKIINALENLGEIIGILFQIKDDELDIFAEESILGKSIGSDIKENKKTLYRLFLLEMSSDEDGKKLEKIFGNKTISSSDIDFVKSSIKKYGIDKKIQELTRNLQMKAKKQITDLGFEKKKEYTLLQLLSFTLERKK